MHCQIGKQFFNMRLAPEDVSDTLSGYTHNAVTPVGSATQLPIILSHKIAALVPDFFFLVGNAEERRGFYCGGRRCGEEGY